MNADARAILAICALLVLGAIALGVTVGAGVAAVFVVVAGLLAVLFYALTGRP